VTVSVHTQQLQQRVAALRQDLDAARHETTEQINARIEQLRDDEATGWQVKEDAASAASRAQSTWVAAEPTSPGRGMTSTSRSSARGQHDVNAVDRDAKPAEDDASPLDLAGWAINQATIAVLDAVDGRVWADARAPAPQDVAAKPT
jgi:uncharacterized protein YhaN